MSKQDFVFTIDAHHFQITSLRNNRKFYIPCAYVRPSTSNGKADFDKVLIFFEKSVANEFNNWMPGHLKQSQATGRWYMVLRPEDIDCTYMSNFDHVRSFIRKAAERSNSMDSDFPIKHLYFRAVDRDIAIVPKLRDIGECDGAFGDAVYFKFNKEEPEEMIIAEKQEVAYYSPGQELTAETKLSIKKIIFSGPATIVMWNDGSKTVVHYNDETETIDDREKAVFAACAKKLLGTNATGSNYLDRIKPAFDEAQEEWAKRIAKKEEK